ncbi:MAG: hypothetical protein MUF42_03810 [Cytophagaceae bacterium]|jgi:hypothetical protein|nr:hypothetical protein [Cytophagaceae bacterium]
MRNFLILLLVMLQVVLWGQRIRKKYIYSSAELGYSNSWFAGNDLSIRRNRVVSPGLACAVYTKQWARVNNGFLYSLHVPTSRSMFLSDSVEIDYAYFKNRIHNFSFFLMVDFIKHKGSPQKRPAVVPYVFMAIGWIKMKHFYQQGIENSKQTVSSITGIRYSKRAFVLPIGPGLRIKLGKGVNLSTELIYNFSFSNQVDLNYRKAFSFSSERDAYWSLSIRMGIL